MGVNALLFAGCLVLNCSGRLPLEAAGQVELSVPSDLPPPDLAAFPGATSILSPFLLSVTQTVLTLMALH